MCLRVLVGGKVQGVGFRNFARRQADALAIAGLATNLEDGRVEVLACGAPEALDALVHALGQGPRWSHVSEVTTERAACFSR